MTETADPENLRRKLNELRVQHRDLDMAIGALQEAGSRDYLQVQRLKKRKLMLKDQIAKLESALRPDIIA